MSGWRLPRGGLVNRNHPLNFRWAGKDYRGFQGDTLASALLASGVELVGRSFKYHRPRGLLGGGSEEPNAIVQLGTGVHTVPNLKASQVELREGLVAAPVNAWPSLDFDMLAVNNWLKRFIPAAFYYKTFLWPKWSWFEPAIRRAAGLGVAPAEPDPDAYEHRFAYTDLLVVGSGASGLAAALEASSGGGQVLLVESDPCFGGGLLAEPAAIAGRASADWLQAALAELRTRPNVTLLPRTTAFGCYDHGLVGLREIPEGGSPVRERLWKVRAGRVILATGAIERPLPFVGNDLPGVMLASAAKTYALRFGVAVGRRVVVATNNDSAYSAASALAAVGVEIAAILDSRSGPSPTARAAASGGLRVQFAAAPIAAVGKKRVSAVEVSKIDGARGSSETIACDSLLVSGGWSPTVHLHSQAGGKLLYCNDRQAFIPSEMSLPCTSVGAAAGLFEMEAAIASATAAVRAERPPSPASAPIGPLRNYPDGDQSAQQVWLDFQNDVTVADVQLAVRENFRSVEHVKRYTTLGMATDQGRTSNVPAIQVVGHLLDKPAGAVGTTRFRPPYEPVTIGTLAGRAVGCDLHPLAELAPADRQRALGAHMEPYGRWLRPAFFARAGEDEAAAIRREVLAVRAGCGLFDASPLGKIEVKGPDAAAFLDRMFVNTLSTLAVGRCRYGVMLSEHGIVFDDGVVARLAPDHFLVGTTSAHAAAVADRFQEWLQCEWTDLRVLTADVTTCWAVMTLAGPRARNVLASLGTDIAIAAGDFPHLSVRSGTVAGLPARVQRISFSGELSFEIAVPWRSGAALWDACLAPGAETGVTPFGVEALLTMRLEKGFLHVGVDTDGTTMPQDIGLSRVVAAKTSDFVGRRSTMQADGRRPDRRQLVGLQLHDDTTEPLRVGAHVAVISGAGRRRSDGWVTSAAFSPTLNRSLAMALVSRGQSRLGEEVLVWDLGSERRARIVDPRAFDHKGERMHG